MAQARSAQPIEGTATAAITPARPAAWPVLVVAGLVGVGLAVGAFVAGLGPFQTPGATGVATFHSGAVRLPLPGGWRFVANGHHPWRAGTILDEQGRPALEITVDQWTSADLGAGGVANPLAAYIRRYGPIPPAQMERLSAPPWAGTRAADRGPRWESRRAYEQEAWPFILPAREGLVARLGGQPAAPTGPHRLVHLQYAERWGDRVLSLTFRGLAEQQATLEPLIEQMVHLAEIDAPPATP